MDLFGVTDAVVEVGLQGTELRQQVLSNNLANANTPGFKPGDVQFGSQLAEALAFGDSASQISQIQPTTSTDTSVMRVDGSGIDVNREATALAQNAMQYEALMGVETKNLTTMSNLITGAR